jgi:hypothetical protein
VVLPTKVYQSIEVILKRVGGLTSQFWPRRDTWSVFDANEVQPSASRPIDISCRRFIANTVRNGKLAPSAIPKPIVRYYDRDLIPS